MAKAGVNAWKQKDESTIEAEEAGRAALRRYCETYGAHSRLCNRTGIDQGALSRMKSGDAAIHLEAAVLLEEATGGVLSADVLCPSFAHVLQAVMQLRYG